MINNIVKTKGATKSAGKVEMTLEAYNELLLELNTYRGAMSLNASGNTLYLEIDTNRILPLIQPTIDKEYPEYTEKDYWLKDSMNKSIYQIPEKVTEE